MRARNIKPGFFKNEELAELPFEARLLFIGLWCLADREGRLEDRGKRIEAEIFPYEKVDIEKHLQALASTKTPFIIRYKVNENHYIQIINFLKHENPNPHEKKSDIPPCKCKALPRKCIAPLNPPSPSLNPPSLNPSILAPREFEKVWVLYPRRKGRKAAERHFKASVKTEVDVKNILRALEHYKQSKEVKEGFIQNGSTWFNNWQDWMEGEINGAHERKSIFNWSNPKGAETGHPRFSKGLREAGTTAGKVLDGVRDMRLPETDREKEPGQPSGDSKPERGGSSANG